MSSRISYLVPSMVALALLAFLVYRLGVQADLFLSVGCVLFGYLAALFSIATSSAGWFRMSASLSHTIVLAYLLAAGLVGAYFGQGNLTLFFNMLPYFPITATAIALAIGLIGKGIRLSRYAKRLDKSL